MAKCKRVDGKDGRVVVRTSNIVKKHQKPMQAGRGKTQVGIIEFEAPINLSNVLVGLPQVQRSRRAWACGVDGESKVRVCKNCGAD